MSMLSLTLGVFAASSSAGPAKEPAIPATLEEFAGVRLSMDVTELITRHVAEETTNSTASSFRSDFAPGDWLDPHEPRREIRAPTNLRQDLREKLGDDLKVAKMSSEEAVSMTGRKGFHVKRNGERTPLFVQVDAGTGKVSWLEATFPAEDFLRLVGKYEKRFGPPVVRVNRHDMNAYFAIWRAGGRRLSIQLALEERDIPPGTPRRRLGGDPRVTFDRTVMILERTAQKD